MVRYDTPGLTGPASSRRAPDPATCKVTGSEPPGLVPSRPVAGKPAAVATGSSAPASRTVQGLPSAVPEPMTPLPARRPSLAIVSCRAGGPGGPPRIAVYTRPGMATASAATTATAPARATRRRLRMRRPRATIAAAGVGPAVMVASARSTCWSRSCPSKPLTTHPFVQGRTGPQLGQRPGNLALDIAHRATQRRRRLSLAHVQPEPQHHHRSLPHRQAHQSGHQRDPVITATGRVHRGRLRHGAGQLLGHPPLPEPATIRIHHHPPHIGIRVPRPADLRPGRIGARQRGLRQVLGQAPIAGQHIPQADQLQPAAMHELAELSLRRTIHASHLPLPLKTTIYGQTVAWPTKSPSHRQPPATPQLSATAAPADPHE